MENKNTIDGFEFLYTVRKGNDQYYEGYTVATTFESDLEVGDTSLENAVILAKDIDSYTCRKIVNKLNSEDFYSKLLEELKSSDLPENPKNTKYSITLGLGSRSEQHYLNEVATKSIIELHQYLKREFGVK